MLSAWVAQMVPLSSHMRAFGVIGAQNLCALEASPAHRSVRVNCQMELEDEGRWVWLSLCPIFHLANISDDRCALRDNRGLGMTVPSTACGCSARLPHPGWRPTTVCLGGRGVTLSTVKMERGFVASIYDLRIQLLVTTQP